MLLLAATLLPVFSASANSFGLRGGIYDVVSDNADYEAYTARADDGNMKADGRHVNHAIMGSRYHNQLIAAVRNGKAWEAEVISTTAVYQPGDYRGENPRLVHADNVPGFELIYDDEEEYLFAWWDGRYVLQSVFFDRGSTYSNSIVEMDGGYLFWQSGRENSGKAIGDAIWQVDPISLEDFNITQLPRSIADVRQMNAVSAALRGVGEVPEGAVRKGDGKGAAKLAVYSAPSEDSWRSASGKASVSLRDAVTVLGRSGDWTLISYPVSLRTSRIGYVHQLLGDDLPEIPSGAVSLVTSRETFLTDDPLVSQYAQLQLPMATQVTGLAYFNEFYAYASVQQGNQEIRGFIPLRDLQLPADDVRWDVMDTLLGTWNFAAGGSIAPERLIFFADGTVRPLTFSDTFWQDMTDRDGTWRIRNIQSAHSYPGSPLYELILTLGDEENHYGLIINHTEGILTLVLPDAESSYTRHEYSTFGNG